MTGGASGIGKGTARRLVEHGANVVVGDIDEDGGRSLAVELGVEFVPLDVADPAAWDRVVAASGPFDIAFLNAGVSTNSGNEPGQPQGFDLESFPIVAMPDAAYRRIMSVNVDGVVFGTRALLPTMMDGRRADIVVTASMAGLGPIAFDPVYGLTKHAVVGFVRSMAGALDMRPGHDVRIERDLPGLHRHQHPDAGPEAADRRARPRDHDARARRRCGAAGAARAGQRRAMGDLARRRRRAVRMEPGPPRRPGRDVSALESPIWDPTDPAFRAIRTPSTTGCAPRRRPTSTPVGLTIITRYDDVSRTLRSNDFSRDVDANATPRDDPIFEAPARPAQRRGQDDPQPRSARPHPPAAARQQGVHAVGDRRAAHRHRGAGRRRARPRRPSGA